MEKFTQEVGGYPFLYADTFMTRPEFEKMFDLTSKTFLFKETSMPEYFFFLSRLRESP